MRVMLDASAVPDRPAGAGIYTLELARHLAPHLDLHLAIRADDTDRWRDLAPEASLHPDAPTPRPRRLLWEQTGALRTAGASGAQLWHGPHYTLPLRLRTPRVVTVHDLTFFEHPEWHESSKAYFFRTMMSAAVRRAAVVVAVSEDTARRTQEILRPRCPVVTIPHGVDHDTFRPATPGNATDLTLLEEFGIRPPYVAFTGTHEPRKNLPGLIAAFARVAPRHPDLMLVLSGAAGWGTDAIERAVTSSPVAERIHRPGRLPLAALPAFFRQAEVVAYPSFGEGFGLPALETLACGGVLLSTSGSAVETFVDDAACLVPPGDTDALTDALDALLRDDTTRSALRRRGPAVAAPFTWKRSAALHVEAYELALGNPR